MGLLANTGERASLEASLSRLDCAILNSQVESKEAALKSALLEIEEITATIAEFETLAEDADALSDGAFSTQRSRWNDVARGVKVAAGEKLETPIEKSRFPSFLNMSFILEDLDTQNPELVQKLSSYLGYLQESAFEDRSLALDKLAKDKQAQVRAGNASSLPQSRGGSARGSARVWF